MQKSSPQLVFNAIAALISGRKIRGDLPSYTELEGSTGASRDTISAVVDMLRGRGYIAKKDNNRHTIATPAWLSHPALRKAIDELEETATALGVTFDDVTALLASRMLTHGDPADDRAGQLELIHNAVDIFRSRERKATEKSTNRPPSKRHQAEAARQELEDTHQGEGR